MNALRISKGSSLYIVKKRVSQTDQKRSFWRSALRGSTGRGTAMNHREGWIPTPPDALLRGRGAAEEGKAREARGCGFDSYRRTCRCPPLCRGGQTSVLADTPPPVTSWLGAVSFFLTFPPYINTDRCEESFLITCRSNMCAKTACTTTTSISMHVCPLRRSPSALHQELL